MVDGTCPAFEDVSSYHRHKHLRGTDNLCVRYNHEQTSLLCHEPYGWIFFLTTAPSQFRYLCVSACTTIGYICELLLLNVDHWMHDDFACSERRI